MQLSHCVSLVLLANLSIVAGAILPAMAKPIGSTMAQVERSDELEAANDEGMRLFEEGSKTSLTTAIQQFERALQLSQAAAQRPQRGLALVFLGRIYMALGEPTKALEYFNQALPIWRGLSGKSGEAVTLRNIGRAYMALGEPTKALDYTNQALLIFRAMSDRSGEASTLNNIGAVYDNLDENTKAQEYYNQALVIWRAVGDRSGEATTLNNLGGVYETLGEPTQALEYFNQALAIYRAVSDRSGEATALNNLGQVYSTLGEPTKAQEFYHQALPIFRFLGDRSGEAATLNNLGGVYDILGEPTKALEFYNQALPIRRAGGARSGEAATLNNLGGVYNDVGEPTKALEYFNQALPILRAVGDRSGEATTLNNIGRVYETLGKSTQAREYYHQALPIRRAVGDRSGEANTLSNLATLYRTENKLTDALQNINAAIQIIESLRSKLQNDALKTAYFASVQGFYQLKIDLLMQLHQQQPTRGYDAQALETADQSRARVLRELLVQANANINKDVSPELRQQEQILNQTIDTQEKQLVQLSRQPGNYIARITTLTQSITTLYAQRDDLKNTIRAANPAYANLQYPQSTTLAQIQQQLDPDTLILQYRLGEEQSYLWVIGHTRLKTYILPQRSDIRATVAAFRQELLNPEQRAPATALTQQILTPAAADFGNKRLVIIPDGVLHTIPFAALNTPNSKTYNPLITQHEITNLPSASTIAILRTTVATKPRGNKQLAILADPIFRKDDPRLTGKTIQANNNLDLGEQIARGRTGRDLDLDRLPFTATEAKGILALVPNQDSTAAFGFDASYDWITDPKISQYRYVHLATHGFFDNDKPALSSIILSSFDAKGNDRKAFLRFPDLFNLNLPTELVVLSACETGLGNNVPGEGLVGMTRGLMYAGALRVAVSLWAVDDQATSDLMQDFYKNLWQTKQSHAASLRQAQLTAWKQGKAPYYWAAFTLQGEWRN